MSMHQERLKTELRTLIEAFKAATGKSASAISKEALKDPNFVIRVDKGRGFHIDTYDRLIVWLSDHWPDGKKWPKGVQRPDVAKPE